MATPYTLSEADAPTDRWDDPVHGQVSWRTLFSADLFPSDALSGGFAYLEPGAVFNEHRHAAAEVYLILEGEAVMRLDGVEHPVKPNTGVFIPGNTLHGIRALDAPVRFFYCFAVDRFSDVEYRFGPGPMPAA